MQKLISIVFYLEPNLLMVIEKFIRKMNSTTTYALLSFKQHANPSELLKSNPLTTYEADIFQT